MSVLRSIENKIAGLVEGTFSRAFRSAVRPVEIARKLAREMDEHRTVALRATYVPDEYIVYLSPRDRERFAEHEGSLVVELAGYLLEHARAERLVLPSRPTVEFVTDERLGLGEFGIETRVSQRDDQQQDDRHRAPAAFDAGGEWDDHDGDYDDGYADYQAPFSDPHEPFSEPQPGAPAPPPVRAAPMPEPEAPEWPAEPPPARPARMPRWEEAASGRTMIQGAAERVSEPLREAARARNATALLLVGGRRMVVGPDGATMGRSRQCDIVLDDPNVSRSHAEVRPRGGSWVLADLGSTNGSRLNGRRVDGPEVLRRGDEIQLGATRLTFELE